MSVRHQLLVIVICLLLGCDSTSRQTAHDLFYHLPQELPQYDFSHPSERYVLPYVLEEVSGLSHYGNHTLACIQDEDGKIYLYDYVKKKIVEVIRFAKSGDYEGVEIFNDQAYVVKSNGDIYQFDVGNSKKSVKSVKIETALNKDNDVEGLTYDPISHSLFLACKGEAGLKKKEKGRAIYLYDLKEEVLKKKPVISMTKNSLKLYLEKHKDFDFEEKRLNFRPSGLAIHPINGYIYIIASTGKLMLIFNRENKIIGSVPLDPRLLGQPEGICFSPSGDLFLSSEGQGDKGYILRFNMK